MANTGSNPPGEKHAMLDWSHPEAAFPRLREDICIRQWGDTCLVVDPWTSRYSEVSVAAAFALSLCYGHFSLAQILDLMESTFHIPVDRAEQELSAVFEQCLHKEMFAVGPLGRHGATQPLGDPRSILSEACRGRIHMGNRFPDPLFLVAVLTDKCNMRCVYCFRSSGKKMKFELGAPEWLSLVDQAAEMKVVRVFVTGGEPTLHPAFQPVVLRLLRHGIFPYISTNGFHLSDGVIRALAEGGLKKIQVSLDATDEALFCEITGIRKGFARVLDNIRRLMQASIAVMVKCVVTPLNYRQVYQLIELCAVLGAHIVDLQPYGNAPYSRKRETLLLTEAHRAEALEQVKRGRNDFGGTLIVMGDGLSRPGKWAVLPNDCTACGGFVSSMVIQPNGDVGPCEMLPTVDILRVGNVREASLSSLWNSARADSIVQPPRKHLEAVCRSCEHLESCRGGCRSYALLYSKNPFAPDPRCPKAALEQRSVLL